MKKEENDKLLTQISKFYDKYHQERNRKPPSWMEMYWHQFKGNVLEIGARTLVPVKNNNISNYLVAEISPVAVKMLKRKGINAVVANGENLPFQDNSFDTVACHDVLEHTPNPERFIAEMCRVSRERVIILGPNYLGEKSSIMRKHSNLVYRTFDVIRGKHKKVIRFENPYFSYDEKWESDSDAVSGVNLWWVERQLEKNGFRVIMSTTFIGKSMASKILGKMPLVKYTGSMMFVGGEKK